MKNKDQTDKNNNAQDWLIISIILWVIFVLIVSLANIISPDYTPPLQP
jgi:hypothetical protein